jgi:predicted YcjX-like family ATPase
MSLSEFLAALNNPQAVVTINEPSEGTAVTELIKMYAAGYEQLLAELLAREVDKVTVVSPQAITVLLKASL